jgi:hypothetical protein
MHNLANTIPRDQVLAVIFNAWTVGRHIDNLLPHIGTLHQFFETDYAWIATYYPPGIPGVQAGIRTEWFEAYLHHINQAWATNGAAELLAYRRMGGLI